MGAVQGEDVARVRDGLAGHLRVGYTDVAIRGRMPRVVSALRRLYPDVFVGFSPLVTAEQIVALRERRIDVGFCTGPLRLSDMRTEPVEEQQFLAVAPLGHRIAKMERVALEALAEEPFVLGDQRRWMHFNAHVFSLCQAVRFTPRIILEAPTSYAILGLVAAGMGVTVSVANLLRGAAEVEARPLIDKGALVPTLAVAQRLDAPKAALNLLALIAAQNDGASRDGNSVSEGLAD